MYSIGINYYQWNSTVLFEKNLFSYDHLSFLCRILPIFSSRTQLFCMTVCLSTIWRGVCPNFAASTILAKIDLTRLDSPTAIHLLPNSAPNHNKISCVLFLLVYTFDCFNQKNISTRALPWISYLRLLDGAVIRPPVPVLCSIMQTTANSLNMLYCG